CAAILISGSLPESSSTVFPIRPAAPISSMCTGDSFIGAAHLIGCSARCPQQCSHASLRKSEILAVRTVHLQRCWKLFARFELFECLAQARLVCFAHFA